MNDCGVNWLSAILFFFAGAAPGIGLYLDGVRRWKSWLWFMEKK